MVDRVLVQHLAKEQNLLYMETSAKTGVNVRNLFDELGESTFTCRYFDLQSSETFTGT